MGGSSSKNPPPILTHCSIPAYCIKTVGSRHFLIAGGGGSAKTGVKNEIELFLLTYNQFSKLGRTSPDESRPNSSTALMARQTQAISTSVYATMNMDVIPIAPLDQGRYLIAAGQDEFCYLYETTGFGVKDEETEIEVPARLLLNYKEITRLVTDASAKDGYQKCVRFDRSGGERPLRMVTGASDGYIRVWNVSEIMQNRDPNIVRKPLVEFLADSDTSMGASEVQDLDISFDGLYLASVAKEVNLWDLNLGRRILTLPNVPQLGNGFKVRSLRFTPLDSSGRHAVFVVAYNQRTMSSKTVSYLALWTYNKESKQCNLHTIQKACNENISSLAVSPCGKFTSIGTMGGSVAIYDTQNMQQLHYAKETHTNFVTAIDFLPIRTYDSKEGFLNSAEGAQRNGSTTFLPGITSENLTSVISLSVDQSIQVHSVPRPKDSSFSNQLVRLALWSLVFYVIVWFLLQY